MAWFSTTPGEKAALIAGRVSRGVSEFSENLRFSLFGYPFLENLYGSAERRRALVVYHSPSVLYAPDNWRMKLHQSHSHVSNIASALHRGGYRVDVADTREHRRRITDRYDIVVSEQSDLSADYVMYLAQAARIQFATTVFPSLHNRRTLDRYERLERRRGAALRPVRMLSENVEFFEGCQAAVVLGDEYVARSWSSNFTGAITSVMNYALPEFVPPPHRDLAVARKRLLYFTSWGHVGRGLDILLEAMRHLPHLDLVVCGSFSREGDFVKAYRRELFEQDNVLTMGVTIPGSSVFNRLMEGCGFIVGLSCTGAAPGAIVNAMSAGLLPVVTSQMGLDLDRFGFVIDDTDPEAVAQALDSATSSSVDELRDRTSIMRGYLSENCTREQYLIAWERVLDSFR